MRTAQPIRESARLLMMAIELDRAAGSVWAAVDRLAGTDLASLVEILGRAPPESSLARAAWERAKQPNHLRALIDRESVDLPMLERILGTFGAREAGVLLDLLCESESIATRRRLLSRLVELAPEIAPELMRRARDPRWYARRNVLVLMGELESLPPKFSPASLADDPHPAVRREAYKLMLGNPGLRDRALCGLLEDRDPRGRSLGLAAATESCPPEAIQLLAAIVRDPSVPTDQRVMGVRALGRSGDPLAVEPLIESIRRGAGLAPGRLGEKSPVMLAALQALATFSGEIGAGRKLIAKATRSKDPDIRAALGKDAI